MPERNQKKQEDRMNQGLSQGLTKTPAAASGSASLTR